MGFLREYWSGVRPFLLKFMIDLSVVGMMYVALLFISYLGRMLPIPGWAGVFFEYIHSAGMLIALVIFLILFVNDIYQTKKGETPCLA